MYRKAKSPKFSSAALLVVCNPLRILPSQCRVWMYDVSSAAAAFMAPTSAFLLAFGSTI